jgi:hypothetical protein
MILFVKEVCSNETWFRIVAQIFLALMAQLVSYRRAKAISPVTYGRRVCGATYALHSWTLIN